jgi:predicted ABC-type transport system involved in lysophospholipase L1 biosynthesis ATPase subunit
MGPSSNLIPRAAPPPDRCAARRAGRQIRGQQRHDAEQQRYTTERQRVVRLDAEQHRLHRPPQDPGGEQASVAVAHANVIYASA